MSLNGLDDVKLKEAHDAAAVEPGGWFLLKYVSRDEVELMGKGNGGIVEIRNAIASYEEPSPLFGFLHYRRRNVLIKYVPEDCSRLVQARVTVHFNAVTERFSPHDTVFPITNSKELRDTTLSAACSLHTASGSTSSSTSSLRRRRLMEIAEDAEEDNRNRQSTVLEERPPTAKAPSVSEVPTFLPDEPPPSGLTPSISAPSRVIDLETFPPPPREPQFSENPPPSPTKTIDESQPRKSSQSTRPELYSTYGSIGRPKVKLGPRPSLDVTGRPHTSGAASHYRPVSTLPAGLKLFSKGSRRGANRPQSHYGGETPSMTISPPPVPNDMSQLFQATPSRPHTSGGRPPLSPRPLIQPPASTLKTPTITPEKARLLKAMEMRKKQMSAPVHTDRPCPSASLVSPPVDRISETPKEVHDSLAMLDGMAKGNDSAIAFDASSTLKTDESDATRSDSYPVSPVGPSEQAESTRASSISELTDETVQEGNSAKPLVAEPELEVTEKQAEKFNSPDQPLDSSMSIEKDVEVDDVEPVPEVAAVPNQSSSQTATTDYVESEISQESRSMVTEDLDRNHESMQNEEEEIQDRSDGHQSQPVPVVADEPIGKDTETTGTSTADPATEDAKPIVEDTILTDKAPSANDVENLNATATAEELVVPPQQETRPVSTASAKWKIPRSKFSMQDLKAEDAIPSIPTEPVPSSENQSRFSVPRKSPVESTFSTDTKRSLTENEQDGKSSKRKKRRGLVEPIRTDIDLTDRSGHNSDSHFSSDEDLMDELQSAVVQEAKPISVSKSPISPMFPTSKKADSWRNRFSRAASNPLRKDEPDSQLLTIPTKDPSRSVSASAAYLNRINQEPAKPIAKKVNLGSGISQRIKALEKFSTTPGATPSPPTTGPTAGSSPSFFSVRKASIRGASKSPSIADRANSFTQNTPSPSGSRESSPEAKKIRERSGSIKNRVGAFESSPIPMNQPGRARPRSRPESRPESISVTARIIRDPSQPFQPQSEVSKDPFAFAPLDLKQSPLVIDHQKAVTPPKETIQERRLSKERRNSTASDATNSTPKAKRSSITIVKEMISDRRSSFAERRRSINLEPSNSSSTNLKTPSRPPSVKSPSRPPSTHASPMHGHHGRSLSISSRKSTSSRDQNNTLSPAGDSSPSINEEKSDKKSNRASRMLRRMSSSLSSGRKALAHAVSPTVREDPEPINNGSQSLASSHPTTPSTPNVNIGDVNVQFPDSLLWKRRSMMLDSQGFLILSPALTASGNTKNKTSGGATRRFHLSEFRPPVIPDVEMQELPNSVVLDFFEGGGLQMACEDRARQGQMLEVLQEAHNTWAAQGQ
ncbi:hypothetical protein G7Y89_g11954 [Cudoniella acicularis]|uniref:ADF-H domain-containing protein n=1 Tax=Cudoniella acicularis TaxID=354080 RepID=A0A8H4R9Z8_9HELO|nr:hypothetical protein G7Y89_g11954 [Cudoniella acicularis]